MRGEYNYLGEKPIGVDAPAGLFERIRNNMEERCNRSESTECVIRIFECGPPVSIIPTKGVPYAKIEKKVENGNYVFEYYRYGSHVATIVENGNCGYTVRTSIKKDEITALRCLKKVYLKSKGSEGKALLHSTLVQVNSVGTLIVGECWSGKTTMAVKLLEELGGVFLSDGRTLISYEDGRLKGHYVPRNIYVRFRGLAHSKNLAKLLKYPSMRGATQIFDKTTISRITKKRVFDVDAGLTLSRRTFKELLDVPSMSWADIDRVIFTRFSNGRPPRVTKVNNEDTWKELSQRELIKNRGFDVMENLAKVGRGMGIIKKSWLSEIEALEVSFSHPEDLVTGILEDLV